MGIIIQFALYAEVTNKIKKQGKVKKWRKGFEDLEAACIYWDKLKKPEETTPFITTSVVSNRKNIKKWEEENAPFLLEDPGVVTTTPKEKERMKLSKKQKVTFTHIVKEWVMQ